MCIYIAYVCILCIHVDVGLWVSSLLEVIGNWPKRLSGAEEGQASDYLKYNRLTSGMSFSETEQLAQ